jgi:hypothetical protein
MRETPVRFHAAGSPTATKNPPNPPAAPNDRSMTAWGDGWLRIKAASSDGWRHSSSVDGRVAGPALRAVDEQPVHLIVLGVHQDRPTVAAQKINGVRTGDENRWCIHSVFEACGFYHLQFSCRIFHDLRLFPCWRTYRDELGEAPFLFWRFVERLFAITVSIDDAVSFPFSLLARKSQDSAALTRRGRCRSSFSAWDSFFSAIAQHSEDVNIAPSVIFGGIFAMNGNRV